MKKSLLAALLVLCGLIVAQTTARKAVVTTHEGAVQEVTIVDESMDSIKVMLLGNTISMPKDKIKSITYPESQSSLRVMGQKLDTLITLQKNQMIDLQYNPLKSRNYGIEISSLGLLTIGQKSGYFSSGFSLFNLDRSAEIIIPLSYSWMTPGYNRSGADFTLTAGIQYRKFLGFFDNVQNGLYISGMLDVAHVQASYASTKRLYNPNTNDYDEFEGNIIDYNENLLGIGFGVGYRRFSINGWYWGVGVVAARYFGDTHNLNYSTSIGQAFGDEFMVDFEILKFGWAF